MGGTAGRHGDRLTVAVVYGGSGGGDEESCRSAAAILAHLDRRRYQPMPVRIGPGGAQGWRGSLAAALDRLDGVDVAFPALHGPGGGDGTVAALLELAGVAHVGSGVLAGAVGADREYTRSVLAAAGLPVATGMVLRAGEGSVSGEDRACLGLPVQVVPARSATGRGGSVVDGWERFGAAVTAARRTDPKVVVEAAPRGRWIDVGVLERPDGTVAASPPLPLDGRPAPPDPATAVLLGGLALRAFEALSCTGLLRVGFTVGGGDDGGEAVVRDVQTLPGLGTDSRFPRMWAAAGVGYRPLLDTLIGTALAWHARTAAHVATHLTR